MTRAEAMREIRRLHTEWSLEHGDEVPYVAADSDPHPGSRSDLSVWQADRSAPAAVDDPLNEAIKAILAEIEGEGEEDDEIDGEAPPAKGLNPWEGDVHAALLIADPSVRASTLEELAKHLPGKHDQSSHGTGGSANPGSMHDEATIRETFGYRDEATGMSAEVTGIRSTGPGSSTYVDIAIKDQDGNVVGEAVRTIRPANQRTVRHDGMALQPGMQGQGFATRFNAHAEESYRAHGIQRITTNANIDVGGYSHARAGYDFANNESRSAAIVHMVTTPKYPSYPQAVRDQVNAAIRNNNVTPIELAMIGHTPGATTWPGKEMLLGSMWEGVKTL